MSNKVDAGTSSQSKSPFIVDLYRSALGKKYLMAITGVIWLGYVLAHMLGNLKLYQSAEDFNTYAEFLRRLLYPILPPSGTLNLMRLVLIVAIVVHIVAAYQLTMMNRRARPESYRSKRDYVAADFAARTMRWTGVIVLLFIAYHLADLTWGWVNPDPTGTVYDRVVASFSQIPVAVLYIVANIALAFHLYHGAWSLFQSLGLNNRRFNAWRRTFAVVFTAVVTIGNLSFPIAVQLGVIS
ncbi:MAG: succinate dehydrogenase cytochrome b subunit [Nitriliruptoraceae bacterium]